MCKIIAITNATKLVVNDKFLNIVKNAITPNERDGFGYSVQGVNGHYGERTTDVNSVFASRFDKPDYLSRYKNLYTETHNTFGTKSKIVGSFIGHGRFSTNSKTLNCTHPYTDGNLTMIHNGVVRDIADVKIKTETPNDSEIIFQYWKRGGMANVVEYVSGYYALAIQEGLNLLHIVKDDTARLHMAYSPVLESLVFATTKEILAELNKAMKWKIGAIEVVKNNTHITFKGNNVEMQSSFIPVKQQYDFDQSTVYQSLGVSGSSLDSDPHGYAETLDDDAKDDLVNDIINMRDFRSVKGYK